MSKWFLDCALKSQVNPFEPDSDIWEAWNLGYAAGVKKGERRTLKALIYWIPGSLVSYDRISEWAENRLKRLKSK